MADSEHEAFESAEEYEGEEEGTKSEGKRSKGAKVESEDEDVVERKGEGEDEKQEVGEKDEERKEGNNGVLENVEGEVNIVKEDEPTKEEEVKSVPEQEIETETQSKKEKAAVDPEPVKEAEATSTEGSKLKKDEESPVQAATEAKAPASASPVIEKKEVKEDPKAVERRFGTLDSVDKTKKEIIEKGEVGSALLDRLAPKEQPAAQPAATGGWGGWGGGWGSLWESATQAVHTVSDVAAQAALALLEDEEDRARAEKVAQKSQSREGPSDSGTENPEISKQKPGRPEHNAAEVAKQAVREVGDAGTEMASFLAANLKTGFSTATDAALKLSTNLQSLAVEDVMEQSLGALENLGKKTLSVITDKDPAEVAAERRRKMMEASTNEQEAGSGETDSLEPPAFADRYEKYGGSTAMSQLEAAARQSETTLQAQLSALSAAEKKQQDSTYEILKKTLKDVGEDEEEEGAEGMKEAGAQCADALKAQELSTDSLEKLQQRLAAEDEWIAKFRNELVGDMPSDTPAEGGDDGWGSDDVKLTLQQRLDAEPEKVLDEVYSRAIDALAFFSATAIAHLLAITKTQLPAGDISAVSRGEAVRLLGSWQVRAINHVSSAYVDLLNAVRDQVESTCGSDPSDKVRVEVVDNHSTLHTTNVFLEAGNASSHVTDAVAYLIPVLRLQALATPQK